MHAGGTEACGASARTNASRASVEQLSVLRESVERLSVLRANVERLSVMRASVERSSVLRANVVRASVLRASVARSRTALRGCHHFHNRATAFLHYSITIRRLIPVQIMKMFFFIISQVNAGYLTVEQSMD